MIYLGSDHGGFKQKEKLKSYLTARGYKLQDMGAESEVPGDDYPMYANEVAKKVIEDFNNRGVLLCRNGAGVCIVANKIKGVRATVAWTPQVAVKARSDDNVNVICIPADYVDEEQTKDIVQAFLDTSFAGEERYKRRLQQIESIEKEN